MTGNVIQPNGASGEDIRITYFKESPSNPDNVVGNVIYVEQGKTRRLFAHDANISVVKKALDAITINPMPCGAVGWAKVNNGTSRYFGFASIYFPNGSLKFEIGYYATGYPMGNWTEVNITSSNNNPITFDITWYDAS